ncbi:MAG TPA: amidohydrolase family protein [Bryobacteraceae bacterium]|nr:amidohydrolase family protein [Bryobacteraceae bacterium]
MIDRREFLSAAAIASVGPLAAQQSEEWGGPVLDLHLHLRADGESNLAHINGSGVTRAVLLTRVQSADQARALAEKYPGRFVRFVSADAAKPESTALLTKAVKDGALGLGEMKNQVECDGPEMRRMYALAADLNVPIQIHFGDVPQASGNAVFNGGFKRFDTMLKAFPKTKFVAHADTFWANVSSDYAYDTAYPSGPIKPGGISDRWLSDFPNLWADMSANSCNNFLNRDPNFTAGFLERHQDKLLFGCDCPCSDGRGGGNTNPSPRLHGKCIARETLAAARRMSKPEVFGKIRWENGVRLLGIASQA